jgi:hypothetical protein
VLELSLSPVLKGPAATKTDEGDGAGGISGAGEGGEQDDSLASRIRNYYNKVN